MTDTPQETLFELHSTCQKSLETTLAQHQTEVARAYLLVTELETWNLALRTRPESELFATARLEYLTSLLTLCQGQYRNAFKGLRLVQELYLQGIFLSTDEIALHEWLSNSRDTSWSAIVDLDQGVFSARFCNVFFPELHQRAQLFGTMSRTLYRELSETIHGNVPTAIAIPTSFAFDEGTFELWISKADTLRLILHFSLSLRYLRKMGSSFPKIQEIVMDQLGHIPQIRSHLGGPT